ncbi:MAG: DNA repair protein RadA, partial [Synergistaceae bacterium]|nr:DNA repair protein RadA [Synergistaceae bacterium]
CGIFSRSCDVYLNVAGGLDVQDPASDLSICAALASSLRDLPVSQDMCFIGEVGLAGEIRPASRARLRMKEAARLGFKRAVVSSFNVPESTDLDVVGVGAVSEMLEIIK